MTPAINDNHINQDAPRRDRETDAPPSRWPARPITGLFILALVAIAFYLGNRLGRYSAEPDITSPGSAISDDRTAAVWTCSMHPEIRRPEPGQCPICGMELVPAASTSSAVRPPGKYACAMMCIPPQDQGGKCPVCGMEMVAVETSGDGDHDTVVTLSETARRLAHVETAAVERRFVDHELRLVGTVDFDETRQRSIAARVPGRLDRLYVDYTGITVAPGDHLVSVYSPDLLTAQEELLQAVKGVREGAQAGVAALREIAQENVRIVQSKLQLWGLTEDQIQEIVERGSASDHITIYAPIGGVVIKKEVVQGMYVDTGMELYTIADLSHVWLKVRAYESDLMWIRYGQAITFEAEAYPGETFTGTVAFVNPTLDERTRTIDVRANVSNPDMRLKPGMFVRATAHARLASGGRVMDPALSGKWMCPMHPEIVAAQVGNCDRCGMSLVTTESLGYAAADPATAVAPLVIPASAPLVTGRRAIVYVADPLVEGAYEGRAVTLGPRAGDFYLVNDGLREGERIAVRGALRIDSAAQIMGKPSMMSPDAKVEKSKSRKVEIEATKLTVTTEFVDRLDSIFTAYFVVQDALSHDQFNEARVAAGKFKQAVDALGELSSAGEAASVWKSDYTALQESVTKLAAAPDMKAMRVAYQPVSNLLITIARRYGTSGRFPVRRYHCPMAFSNKGADWLQNKSGIENPYFGAEMFSCGVLKEVIHEGPAETRP